MNIYDFLYHKNLLEHFSGLNGLNKEQLSLLFIINDMLYWLHILVRDPLAFLWKKTPLIPPKKETSHCMWKEKSGHRIRLCHSKPQKSQALLPPRFLTPSPVLPLLVCGAHLCFTKEPALQGQGWRWIEHQEYSGTCWGYPVIHCHHWQL